MVNVDMYTSEYLAEYDLRDLRDSCLGDKEIAEETSGDSDSGDSEDSGTL